MSDPEAVTRGCDQEVPGALVSTAEPSLGQICLQVHPGRAPALDVGRLATECEVIARRTEGVRGLGVSEGDDDGAYLNIVFATVDTATSWPRLREALLASTEFGAALMASSICMCTGEGGWDDYLLLYHFDPTVPLDDLVAGAGSA